METSSIFVDKFYEMDPEFDELVPEGTGLQTGMIVLIEDSMNRVDVNMESNNKYAMERARENNRWCTVSDVKIRRRYIHDEVGAAVCEDSPLVSFVATYADGTKKKRSYDSSYAWIVKIDSIPECTNPECPEAGSCRGKCFQNF